MPKRYYPSVDLREGLLFLKNNPIILFSVFSLISLLKPS